MGARRSLHLQITKGGSEKGGDQNSHEAYVHKDSLYDGHTPTILVSLTQHQLGNDLLSEGQQTSQSIPRSAMWLRPPKNAPFHLGLGLPGQSSVCPVWKETGAGTETNPSRLSGNTDKHWLSKTKSKAP